MKRKIILGLTGSVATVLWKKLIVEFQKLGQVDVILTERAKGFLSIDEIYRFMNLEGAVFHEADEWEWNGKKIWEKNDNVLHIDIRNRGSALVIAPCSANTMGKMANGICDNLLTSVARAWDVTRPIIIAPAMNTHMWNHPVTEENITKFRDWGYNVIEPQEKMLACGTYGMGALASIDTIVEAVRESLQWSLPIYPTMFSGIPVGNHPGAFACQRKHEKHTGVDLYCEEGTEVCAVETGTVVGIEHFTGEWDNSPWWNNTDCILIEGSTGVVCYGEVEPRFNLKVGDVVMSGEWIADVKRVLKDGKERPDIPGHSTSMLHMELYPHGTVKASDGFEEHLLNDITPFLLEAEGADKVKQLKCS